MNTQNDDGLVNLTKAMQNKNITIAELEALAESAGFTLKLTFIANNQAAIPIKINVPDNISQLVITGNTFENCVSTSLLTIPSI